MTVIAYKGGILAADRLATSGQIIEVLPSKLFILSRVGEAPMMGALCGVSKASNIIKKHLEQHGVDHNLPIKLDEYDPGSIYGLLITAYGSAYLIYGDATCLLQDTETPFIALGSGYEFAWGALAAGASAVQACQLAGLHLSSCGGGTTWVNVREVLLDQGTAMTEAPL